MLMKIGASQGKTRVKQVTVHKHIEKRGAHADIDADTDADATVAKCNLKAMGTEKT